MADPDMAKFNKAVEKLCVDCTSEVNKFSQAARALWSAAWIKWSQT